jgi:hypothetical protein
MIRLVLIASALCACTATPRLEVRRAFEPDGASTPEWRAVVETHTGKTPDWAASPLEDEERAWLALIEERWPAWEARMTDLCAPFEGVRAPECVDIVVGHQHGEDGFGLGGEVIYFDVSALARNYGSAADPANAARIDRFFAHEYTHVLHWRWERAHPQPVATPLDRALWAMAREGLGNLRSLSESWVGADGELTPLARETLAELEPVLVERLEALARAAPEEEATLTEGLSWGPFRKKWGALPVALWLAEESGGDDLTLRPFVTAGSSGVLELARRHLAPELAACLPRAGALGVR